MFHSGDPRFRPRAESSICRRGSSVLRALALVASFGVAFACVDLTPPPEVVNYRNGLGKGGQSGGATGAAGTLAAGGAAAGGSGGATGAGGMTSPGSGGSDTDAPLAGGAAGRDAASSGGAGGTTKDASDAADVPLSTGGAAGAGGIVATGGTTSTGGVVASGGTVSAGGKTGTGGATASGGVVSSGGATASGGVVSAGGATASGGSAAYNCASAIVPASGVVTDFKDWNATTARWGTGTLTGTIYQYAGGSATMNTAKVEGTTPGLHLVGSVPSGAYGGGGLTFLSCVTAASFTTISFDVYGSAANCSIELQLQTFDQRPVDQSPAGGCKNDGGSSCYKFPLKSRVVTLSTAVAAPGQTVSTTLSTMTNWSASEGAQIVGVQWQFTANGGTCTPDATFTNIKFGP